MAADDFQDLEAELQMELELDMTNDGNNNDVPPEKDVTTHTTADEMKILDEINGNLNENEQQPISQLVNSDDNKKESMIENNKRSKIGDGNRPRKRRRKIRVQSNENLNDPRVDNQLMSIVSSHNIINNTTKESSTCNESLNSLIGYYKNDYETSKKTHKLLSILSKNRNNYYIDYCLKSKQMSQYLNQNVYFSRLNEKTDSNSVKKNKLSNEKRLECYNRSHFDITNMKEIICKTLSIDNRNKISDKTAIVVSSLAKQFICHLTKEAKKIQMMQAINYKNKLLNENENDNEQDEEKQERNMNTLQEMLFGPIRPLHIRQAFRNLQKNDKQSIFCDPFTNELSNGNNLLFKRR